jgi:glycosyltransferase involved in cell wall biosynthesis
VNWKVECTAVIPCLNEAATIESLIREAGAILPHVIVVDDGSIDETSRLATRAGAAVIRHPKSRGKGAALAAGWLEARRRKFRWALSMDGDGQHAPGDIPRLLECAAHTTATLVVGNRMTEARSIPWLRRVVNQWMSRRISRLIGRDLPDTQCGFRLMDLEAWSRVHVNADRFEIESELLCKFLAAGERVEFVPIQVIYRGERSKIRPVRDTHRWFRWWWQTRGWHQSRVLDKPLEKSG